MNPFRTLARSAVGLGIGALWVVLWGVPSVTSYRAGQYGEAVIAAAVLLIPLVPLVAAAWSRFGAGSPVSEGGVRADN